ncbi:MAG: aminoglycoside phosphotransferase family protein [Anaerolineaceae bacterium]|jgi:streptomycin 6-kinase|nr:aminoglycoside phosphotransferase family protein [Anaerolineaceae bacterium]
MSDQARLNHYLTAWALADPQLLTQTMTSDIYTVTHKSETVILKLLAPTETEEQRGALALRYFEGHGAVRLLYHDDGAHLLEYAAGDELVTLVERGEDENATRVIAQVIRQLHSVPQDAPRDGMFTLERWFRALFLKGAADRGAGVESIYVRGAALAERLLADQREVRVLHGDIHHRNIRQSARGWLAFDPKGVVGERTYDCANTLCNPAMTELVHNETRLLTNAAILADELDIELPRVLAFTYMYACLNASWWLQENRDEEMVEWSLKVANIIEPYLNPAHYQDLTGFSLPKPQ